MTLHETVEAAKKTWLGAGIGLAAVITLFILFKVGVVVKDILFPPETIPPNQLYGELTPIQFPETTITTSFQYTIDTANGDLPATGVEEGNFPDRLHVYKIIKNTPDLNRLEKAQAKVKKIGFRNLDGSEAVPNALTEPFFEWNDMTGINRKIIINTLTYDFDLTSDYLTSLIVMSGQRISNQESAIDTVDTFLNAINQYPADIDIEKTKTPLSERTYTTTPELYDIPSGTGTLQKVTSLSDAKAIRVDLYQQDLVYELDTGKPWVTPMQMTLPILYPKPPHSTMNFIIASGQDDAEIVEAHFKHNIIEREPQEIGIYPIKTAEEAYQELTEGKAYIAAAPNHTATDNQVLVSDVYLAYYLGEGDQYYLMPIIVFQDRKGFFAYVSALRTEPLLEEGVTEEATSEATGETEATP